MFPGFARSYSVHMSVKHQEAVLQDIYFARHKKPVGIPCWTEVGKHVSAAILILRPYSKRFGVVVIRGVGHHYHTGMIIVDFALDSTPPGFGSVGILS